jgi:hypothetical protein
MVGPKSKQTISRQGLLDACHFAAKSGRMVWHNPPKGGARLPESAHFQSMPVYWHDHGVRRYTFPCCMHQPEAVPWTSVTELTVRFLERGVRRNQYPILGVTVSGPIRAAADYVWDVIWSYDKALACNLIMQPGNDSSSSASVRVFVFPRSRSVPRFSVTENLLQEHEKMLMQNSRGGQWTDWSFAGVEMGLLTQVEWGVLFEEMRANPEKWGRTLMRLLAELTLKEGDEDWRELVSICR